MSKTAASIVEDLNERLRKAGQPCMTMTWPDFYGLCQRERMRDPLQAKIRELASGRFQLIVAYGDNAVVICHDRNFAAA